MRKEALLVKRRGMKFIIKDYSIGKFTSGFIIRGARLFFKKRSENQETFPGMWDASVGGHVDLGENL